MEWPDRLLALADWEALPGTGTRNFELVEGVLLARPAPPADHQKAVFRLAERIDGQLPDGYVAVPQVEVLVDPLPPVTVRVPDVVVVTTPFASDNPARCAAEDVVLAVEVVSPGTGRTDRIAKPIEYAEAGIAHYWLLDLDDPTALVAFSLVDGVYEHVAGGTGRVEVPSPFPVALDLPALLSR